MLLKAPLNVQKKQRFYYPGKKKRHTLKTQVIVEKKTRKVLAIKCYNGKRYDIRVFRDSNTHIAENIDVVTDTGYQGLQKEHAKTRMPKKRSKKKPLTKADKENNKKLSSERVLNEHVIESIKRFKIVADKYRNRRKRFALRFNLISGIHNFEV